MIENFQIFDKKLLILYILDTAGKSLSTEQIFTLCSEVSKLTYFDICDYLDNLRNNEYITEELVDEVSFYYLTENGKKTLQELIELIPGVDIYKLKKMISSTITEIKRQYEVGASTIPLKDENYKVNLYIKDDNEEIFSIMLYAGSKETAKTISKCWQENSENIHTNILKMLTEE